MKNNCFLRNQRCTNQKYTCTTLITVFFTNCLKTVSFASSVYADTLF
ncbi:hypothetical protein D920_02728 [Enterococcus faecalis 13-SD-W-01]|nr:hypothetical protein D920_02728 [Enterococcus faecalis 13-SD-W-01]